MYLTIQFVKNLIMKSKGNITGQYGGINAKLKMKVISHNDVTSVTSV